MVVKYTKDDQKNQTFTAWITSSTPYSVIGASCSIVASAIGLLVPAANFAFCASSAIISPAGFQMVSGRKKLAIMLATANSVNTIITLKPVLMQLSMMYWETARAMAPVKVMRLMPMTLTWVGQSSVMQMQKQVNSAEMQKVMTNMAARMPMLPLRGMVDPSVLGRQMKISTKEQTKIMAIEMIAKFLLLTFLTTKQQKNSETTQDTPSTTPLMKMSIWKSLSMRLGAKNMKEIESWTTMRRIVSHLKEGYLNRSKTVNLDAFSSYFYLICSILLTSAISQTFRLGSPILLTFAIHISFFSVSSGVRVVTKTMGVSTITSMKPTRTTARGMRKKQIKTCCQSLSQKQRPVSTRWPKLKKICTAIMAYSLQFQSMISERMVMLMQKIHWNPIMLIIMPTEATQMWLAKMVRKRPPMQRLSPPTMKVLRPKQSPEIAISAFPIITPMQPIIIERFTVPDSELHLKSPNLLAKVSILFAGMKVALCERGRLQTQSMHETPVGRVEGQVQASSQKTQGAMKMIWPLRHVAIQRRVSMIFWQRPKEPTFQIRLKNILSLSTCTYAPGLAQLDFVGSAACIRLKNCIEIGTFSQQSKNSIQAFLQNQQNKAYPRRLKMISSGVNCFMQQTRFLNRLLQLPKNQSSLVKQKNGEYDPNILQTELRPLQPKSSQINYKNVTTDPEFSKEVKTRFLDFLRNNRYQLFFVYFSNQHYINGFYLITSEITNMFIHHFCPLDRNKAQVKQLKDSVFLN